MGESIHDSAVWERVTAASRSEQKGEMDTGPIGPELLAAIERAQTAASDYRNLMSRAPAGLQPQLRTAIRQKRQQVRDLSALYFFLTGQRPALSGAARQARRESLPDGLRRMLQGEELTAGRLEALAARSTGEAQEALRTQCIRNRQLFHQLLPLLGQSIEG